MAPCCVPPAVWRITSMFPPISFGLTLTATSGTVLGFCGALVVGSSGFGPPTFTVTCALLTLRSTSVATLGFFSPWPSAPALGSINGLAGCRRLGRSRLLLFFLSRILVQSSGHCPDVRLDGSRRRGCGRCGLPLFGQPLDCFADLGVRGVEPRPFRRPCANRPLEDR